MFGPGHLLVLNAPRAQSASFRKSLPCFQVTLKKDTLFPVHTRVNGGLADDVAPRDLNGPSKHHGDPQVGAIGNLKGHPRKVYSKVTYTGCRLELL